MLQDTKESETPRGTISRDLAELKAEAKDKHFCARCLVNAGLRVEVKGKSCPNCGALWDPKFHKI